MLDDFLSVISTVGRIKGAKDDAQQFNTILPAPESDKDVVNHLAISPAPLIRQECWNPS
jgi:hypothetical protein